MARRHQRDQVSLRIPLQKMALVLLVTSTNDEATFAALLILLIERRLRATTGRRGHYVSLRDSLEKLALVLLKTRGINWTRAALCVSLGEESYNDTYGLYTNSPSSWKPEVVFYSSESGEKVVESMRVLIAHLMMPYVYAVCASFHAASSFKDIDRTSKYLLDKYIPSYTLTLWALINARSYYCKSKASHTPVIEALRKTTRLHFVRHGSLDPLPNAEFALLSACHTAEQPHDSPHDEVLRLATAMQSSGYRSVIGTILFTNTNTMCNYDEGVEAKFKRAATGLREAAVESKARIWYSDGLSDGSTCFT
ncbi:uncharacterized protein FOMMEDRAFT_159534 [Fomitiporia mediterranea MF3/22]|uniref:uncharacterized protein n=1 Tax=Fomitiporia mediterranea (strain MF3/22) TaxID=694068 RepID=UPI0004408E21|nr:uncharacterized protein FOMMEDRAFT_159534 [Fomitiporia mediterranea MF3/22]EJC99957.1 hypothetical protein FOMMEDRAFT_159534 [Fomitiporia mediterranea MF3/22]